MNHMRHIKSFVIREGRMTPRQRIAFETLLPKYRLSLEGEPLDLDEVFGRKAPRILEIGFGMGEALATLAQAMPSTDFIGIEVHRPGVGKLLAAIDEHQMKNIRIFCDDAVEVLKAKIQDGTLDKVQIFFPDPWPKKRHHKRRLIQKEFVELLFRKLKVGGQIHVATDWENYADQINEVFTDIALSERIEGGSVPRPESRPITRFEARGKRLGHSIWDIIFTKLIK